MNLRWVHAVLILFSAALAVVVGIWCWGGTAGTTGPPAWSRAVAAFAASLGLVVYDSWFLSKTRTL